MLLISTIFHEFIIIVAFESKIIGYIFRIIIIIEKRKVSGEFAAFKLSVLLYGAEKYIAVTDMNVLFLYVFFYRLRICRSFRAV